MVSNSMKARPASKIRPMSAPVASSTLGVAACSMVLDIGSSSRGRPGRPSGRSDRQGLARVDAGSRSKTRGQHSESALGVRRLEFEERSVLPRRAGAEQTERTLELRWRFLFPLPLEEVAL